jgi:CsoR family transcriptional regulator, copper-sensing transcriptional repressor
MKQKQSPLVRRLKIVEGQIRGLQRMVAEDKYCIDIITQTSAVKQALSNIEDSIMEAHLGGCAIHQIKAGKTEKAVSEILKVYKLKRK